MYYDGQGVLQDHKEAVKWYTKAAEQGYASAQSNLGVMYDNGRGVVQDHAKAHMWFNLAAANGYEIGRKNRDIIAKEMTSDQIAEAQKMAREWMAKKGNKYSTTPFNQPKPQARLPKPQATEPIPQVVNSAPQVIESKIDGEFKGWEGETVIKLLNGQIWQQSEYHYHYHYAYMPDVLIYISGGGYKMKVEGVEKAVGVRRLK